jgi:hypothetical protein
LLGSFMPDRQRPRPKMRPTRRLMPFCIAFAPCRVMRASGARRMSSRRPPL